MTKRSGMAWLGGTLAFVTEIGMLIALGVWGFAMLDSPWTWIVGLGVPLLVASAWGAFLSPKASYPIREPAATVVMGALFLVASCLLYVAGYDAWAYALVGVASVGLIMSALWPLDLSGAPGSPAKR